jgi:membrane protein
MEIKKSFLSIAGKSWSILRDAYRVFRKNDPLRMAAATSFFSSFALPPIMIILIEVFGVFADPKTIRHDLFKQLGVGIDRSIALQVREIVRNLHYLSLNREARIGGFIFLLFVATTLFEVISRSLNQLWGFRLKEHQGLGFLLLHRIKSIGIILMGGLLFSTVLLGDAKGWLLPLQVNEILYRLITTLTVIIWFVLILKYLSYGRPTWRMAIAGAIFTGVLFTCGQLLLHQLLTYDNLKTIYGVTASLALLLLFVFYCSFMFYFGACFTRALAEHTGKPIPPAGHAIRSE